MQSFFPRPEGSANEAAVIRLIEERLQLLKITPLVSDFSKSTTGHSFSKIIEASIDGEKQDLVIVAIPLGHAEDATKERDGSYGIALGLQLLAYFSKHKPLLSLKVIFLGGEFGEGDEYPLGTAHIIHTSFPVQRQMVLYLDIASATSGISIQSGGKGIVSPLWLLSRMLESLAAANMPYSIQANRQQVFLTGLPTAKTFVEAYLKAGFPAIGLSTNRSVSEQLPTKERAQALTESLIRLIDSFKEGIPDEWDMHYLIFSLPIITILIPETAYVIFLLALTLFLIVIAATRTSRLKKYFRTLKRNAWNMPFFLFASFAVLVGATLVLDLLLYLKNTPALWTYIPALFLLLKIALFFFTSTLLFRLFQRFPFSKNGSFYTASALFFTLISLLIIAFINISFTFYFLWALVFIVLFSMARSKRVKVIFFILAPLSIIAILYDIFSIPELKLCEFILFNGFIGNLLFAFVILPFVLLLIRIRLFFPYRKSAFFTSKSFLFMSAFLLAFLVSGIVLLVYSPFSARTPQPVLAEYNIDFDAKTATLVLDSPAPLGNLMIIDKTGPRPFFTSARNRVILLQEIKDYFSYSIKSTQFANRKNIDINLDCKGEPYKIKVSLSAESGFKLYDSNFPAQSVSDNRYEISIGVNPPPSLLLELTLPVSRTYTLSLEVIYKDPTVELTVEREDISVERRLSFKKSILLPL